MLPDYQLLDAARFGSLERARDAIAQGANVHARDLDGSSALFLACTHGHMPLAELLVDRGADVDATFGKRRQTLLHWAADNASSGIATFLLSHQANVNAQRSDGSTPLLLAAKHGHQYLVQLLLKHHALLSPQNESRVTARSAASRAGHSDIVGLIDAAMQSRPAQLQAAEEEFQRRPGERLLF